MDYEHCHVVCVSVWVRHVYLEYNLYWGFRATSTLSDEYKCLDKTENIPLGFEFQQRTVNT